MLTRRTVLALMASAVATPSFAASPEIFQTDGIAINGYDPVAYFTESRPVAGLSQNSLRYMDATWHFASAANRDAFASNPEQYMPQFGGYCAFAASKNALATTVPEAWTVYNGKLYLNFNLRARELWRRDMERYIELAEGFWPGILG